MAVPQTRDEFKQYVLRKLGHPVIEINVADEQVEDRIDEAIRFWQDHHFDGSQLIYLKHELTQDDIDNGYIEVPKRLLGVVRIWDVGSSIFSGMGMFNVTYQFVLNNIQDITGYSVQNYYMAMQHISFLQEILVGRPLIRFQRHVNRVYIDGKQSQLQVGSFIIVEAYDAIDEEANPDMWNDRFLQNYAAALVKESWGSNTSKYENVQLMGGIVFNGMQILNDAREERRTLEEQAISGLQPLVYNFYG